MDIASKIKELRVKHNLTQQEVADKLGVTQGTYGKYENSKLTLSIEVIGKIAAIYEISISELIETAEESLLTLPSEDTGKRFLKVRETYCMSQDMFSDFTGISRSTIANIETNNKATTENIELLSKRTGVRAKWLIAGDGHMFYDDDGKAPERLKEIISSSSISDLTA